MSKQQQALWAHRQGIAAWKETLTVEFDSIDQIIFQIAAGDVGKIEDYRWNKTHTAIIEAYISKIIS